MIVNRNVTVGLTQFMSDRARIRIQYFSHSKSLLRQRHTTSNIDSSIVLSQRLVVRRQRRVLIARTMSTTASWANIYCIVAGWHRPIGRCRIYVCSWTSDSDQRPIAFRSKSTGGRWFPIDANVRLDFRLWRINASLLGLESNWWPWRILRKQQCRFQYLTTISLPSGNPASAMLSNSHAHSADLAHRLLAVPHAFVGYSNGWFAKNANRRRNEKKLWKVLRFALNGHWPFTFECNLLAQAIINWTAFAGSNSAR